MQFEYGPNREKIRRLNFAHAADASTSDLTHYIGSAEAHYVFGRLIEVKRYLGPLIVVQSITDISYNVSREYFLTDAQGSTFAVLTDWGEPLSAHAEMSFDPFGRRRDAQYGDFFPPWSIAWLQELDASTRHGYTGHEQVDSVNAIHMNGRIYDPIAGRFLQPDPYVQDPLNSQSLNRYSYVLNNPMAFTDPTGYFSLGEFIRDVVAIYIAYQTGGIAYGLAGEGLYGAAAAVAFAGGFAAGAVQTGNARGAAQGGLTSLVFLGVGEAFPVSGSLDVSSGASIAEYAERALASGIAGGVLAQMQGGRFGAGFASAGFSSALTPTTHGSNPVGQGFVAAIVGGTASVIAGGKFANGAITASFSFAFSSIGSGAGGQGSGPGDGSLEAKLGVGGSRGLTEGEIAMSSGVFGDDVDYSDVQVFRKKFIFFQRKTVAMTPNGNMYFRPDEYLDDFSTANVDNQAWFMHEMTHVWQHQQGVNVAVTGMFDRNYDYGTLVAAPPGRAFSSFGIEQQGDIVRDYYYLGHGYQIQGAASISTYQSILPFHRGW